MIDASIAPGMERWRNSDIEESRRRRRELAASGAVDRSRAQIGGLSVFPKVRYDEKLQDGGTLVAMHRDGPAPRRDAEADALAMMRVGVGLALVLVLLWAWCRARMIRKEDRSNVV